jgi:ABC-2 type transport system permease protein
MAVFAALFGLLGAVRAMRAEEDAGRAELVLAGTVSRRKAFLSQLAAIGAGAAVLWLALFVAFLAGRLPVGGSAYLALAIVSVVPVFAGVGAIASQLAPNKRMATGLATGVLVIAFTLRTVAAQPSAGVDWLRWATPLGWPAGETVWENRYVIWGRMSWGLLREYEVYEDTEKSTALDEYLAGAGEVAA